MSEELQDGGYTVGVVAHLMGISVRTLHHYDGIGLVTPSERSDAGYRRYRTADLDRLRQVLFYRELGFGLDRIAALLDSGDGVPAHLERQRLLLLERIHRLQRMVTAIDIELEAERMAISLTPQDKAELFGDFDPDAHEEEARERWGETDAYAQSRRRTSNYGKADWVRIKAAAADIEQGLAALLAAGAAATDEAAMDLAEQHRQHITRWYYDCSYQMHVGQAEMYTADERFTAYYETRAPGLAGFVAAAITASAARAAG